MKTFNRNLFSFSNTFHSRTVQKRESTDLLFETTLKALFIWSRVPVTTLPPSYPGRANFSLISLKNSTNCLHENANSSRGARQLGWAGCLVSAGRVTLSGGTTFSHINTLARLPEARWLKLFPEPAILSNM